MAEASLLFPIVCLLLSFALMGYLYHEDITQAIQACRQLFSRLVQRIHKKAKHAARWTSNYITGHSADNANLEAGEYELVESPGLHPGLIINPPDMEDQHPSDDERSSNACSVDSPSSQFRAILSDGHNNYDDALWRVLLRSGWHARHSRLSGRHQHLRDCPSVDINADQDITPADWEIDRANRIDKGGPGARLHGMVDRVVERFRTNFEADIVDEIADSA